MREVQAGERPALGELYDRFASRAYRTAFSVCHDRDCAHDAVQDASRADDAKLFSAAFRPKKRKPAPTRSTAASSRNRSAGATERLQATRPEDSG